MLATSTPYEIKGQWFFLLQGELYGPFATEKEAEVQFQIETGAGKGCPTCEE